MSCRSASAAWAPRWSARWRSPASPRVLAVPLGVLGAVYLNEYGGNGILARLISFMSSVMTGVPSIVMGLFIYIIWVLHFGYSGMAGSFALACLMLPIVIRSSYEMLRLVPDSLRQGSYALGATKARVTLTVVLPAALSGIVSGALLAVARAAGRDGAADLHHPDGRADQPQPVQRAGHVAAAADLLERAVRLHGRERPRLGRGAHAGRNHIHTDDCGPYHHGPIHPQYALGISWKSSRTAERTAGCGSPPPTGHPRHGAGNAIGRHVRLRRAEHVDLLRRVPRGDRRLADRLRERDHRVHRAVRLRQDDGAPQPQPDERPDRRGPGGRRHPLPRRAPVRQRRLPDRGPAPHRDGLPEGQPVPEVDLRQHRLRAAHQRHPQQGQAGRDRRAVAERRRRSGTRSRTG